MADGGWIPVALLHNLPLAEPIEANHAAVVPAGDPRIVELARKQIALRCLVNGFQDQFGAATSPSVLLFDDQIELSVDAIINFRNILAASAISRSWEDVICHGSVFDFLRYSDYFDLFPYAPRLGEGWEDMLVAHTPALLATHEAKLFRGQPSPQVVTGIPARDCVDDRLFPALQGLWCRAHGPARSQRAPARAVFRSLQMAYRAAALPFGNRGGLHDYGTSAALWVSAFEILMNTGSTHVTRSTVPNFLGGIVFYDGYLNGRRFRHRWTSNGKGKTTAATLAQKTYWELYEARNAFLHGSRVRPSTLFVGARADGWLLTQIAPVIYKCAVLSRLGKYKIARTLKEQLREALGHKEEHALRLARRPQRRRRL